MLFHNFHPFDPTTIIILILSREKEIMFMACCAVSVIQTPICCFMVLILSVSNNLVIIMDYDSMCAVHRKQNYNKSELICAIPSVHLSICLSSWAF